MNKVFIIANTVERNIGGRTFKVKGTKHIKFPPKIENANIATGTCDAFATTESPFKATQFADEIRAGAALDTLPTAIREANEYKVYSI